MWKGDVLGNSLGYASALTPDGATRVYLKGRAVCVLCICLLKLT